MNFRPAARFWCVRSSPYSLVCRNASTLTNFVPDGSSIYALSTPPGRGALAVVRVNGESALDIASALRSKKAPELKPLRPTLAKLFDKDQQLLDNVVLTLFPKNRSYTGDNLLEISCHGSPPTVSAILNAIAATGLARPADPGEFTRLAFLNGAMDLTEVEGLRDLLDAETELQRQAALCGAGGFIKKQAEQWRSLITQTLTTMTAYIDFAEDNELEEGITQFNAKAHRQITKLRTEVQGFLEQARYGAIVKEGIRMALVGPPNAGKSSLLNYLSKKESSLVSSIPGTTRDVVEVAMDIGGHRIVVGDTAGLRKIDAETASSHEQLEALGAEKARETANQAQILLLLWPLDRTVDSTVSPLQDLVRDFGIEIATKKVILVYSKGDLIASALSAPTSGSDVVVSTKSGEGITCLIDKITSHANAIVGLTRDGNRPLGQEVSLASASQRTLNIIEKEMLPAIDACLQQLDRSDIVLALGELDVVANCISKIQGERININEILDEVFSTFCIGK